MTTAGFILCEISATRKNVAADLASIVHVCAQDLGIALKTKCQTAGASPKNSVITLHAAVEAADNKNLIWCLACRLACFCPRTRVSVLVHSETAFSEAAPQFADRQSA